MIGSIRHKGLKALHERDQAKGIDPRWLRRVKAIMTRLDSSTSHEDMDLPGLALHPLKGNMAGFWSVAVSGNWRIVFRFENGRPYDVDLIDYH